MTEPKPTIRPCKVRMTFHYEDGSYESVTVIGEERRNCPVSPEKAKKYREFKEARERAIREAEEQARRESA
jgi:hypothetical protein